MSSFKQAQKQRGRKLVKKAVLQKFTPYDVILSPMMTEKSYKQSSEENKFIFKVHREANKNDVRHAIMAIYGVNPIKVNTAIMLQKGRAHRSKVRGAFKKAVVTLKKWDTIDLVA